MQKIVLVTGGAGFIGTHLCGRLSAQGHRVISLDNYFAGSRENHIPGVEYREGHTKHIKSLVPETPDLIYHLGEYARVEQSILEPDIVHDLNVVGTAAVIDYWKEKGSKLLYAGSSTKFGDGGATRRTSPYAFTKAANTELVKEVGEKESLPFAITYFYNVYGPGERAGIYGTVIENFKRMYLEGMPCAVTTPGTQTRNFTHVDDIVDGLILVGEKGHGDEYGLGSDESFSVIDVANMFGSDIIMLPERAGNRMQTGLETAKSKALGWNPQHSLRAYVDEFLRTHVRGAKREKRVLIFSTTFYPVAGPAEKALVELMEKMPDVQFDVVTTVFTPQARTVSPPAPNAHIYRMGLGRHSDKYLLPILGYRIARSLHRKHQYLFAWSLMASYAALLGVAIKRATRLPLLITLADQNLQQLSPVSRFILRRILTGADQVYGASIAQEASAAKFSSGKLLRRSIGEGDAFANQLRYVYAQILSSTKSKV